jgi:Ca2+-transporting ATPase
VFGLDRKEAGWMSESARGAAWYRRSAESTIAELESDATQGLSTNEARLRRERLGKNELLESSGRGPWRILWEQLSGAMVLLLIVAAVVSALLHETTDTIVIVAIVVLNAALGFFQDYRAERALAALKKLSVPTVRVRRDGTLQEVSARDLVPGDIVQLEVGNFVPADGRIIESVNLKVEEAALTGESAPVEKHSQPLKADELPLSDRHNMAFMGTVITYGHGQAVLTDTGMRTELGKIAESLQSVTPESTPLQKRLARLGQTLALVAIGIVVVVFLLGLVRGEDPRLMLLTALSLAVAVVPEGLPAVATVSLALGARQMFAKNALIRKLPAVETLGSVTVICSDKTGTLTENRMTVTMLDVAGDRLDLSETSRSGVPFAEWDASAETRALRSRVSESSALSLLLMGAGLCNDAELKLDTEQHGYTAIGDPTEGALAVAAALVGLRKDMMLQRFPRIDEVPFDSERKRMTTLHRVTTPDFDEPAGPLLTVTRLLEQMQDATLVAVTKGAVDSILNVCDQVWVDDEAEPLDDSKRRAIMANNDRLAADGMRVLGVALRPVVAEPEEAATLEQNLIFVGILGMIDPPRPEVGAAVERCRQAGIRPMMITGDHPLTARHIASQLNVSQDDRVLTGPELDRMDPTELQEAVNATSVYARVTPKHKLQLVQALQAQGQVVAMTGDGVNDAPALKQAHIGVAMGITGTDVSKEASQMVLLDDNFATIVNAVEQGRIVYDNIRKFVRYTLTSNCGEVCVMLIGPLLGMPIPLLPLQILWINLVTDGLPGLALAFEKAEYNTMRRPPYPQKQHMFSEGLGRDIAWIGLLMGVVSLLMGYLDWKSNTAEERHWRTIIFTTITLAQMSYVMALRSKHDSLFTIGIFSNPLLIVSVGLTFLLQLSVIYIPWLQNIFKTTALSGVELALCILMSSTIFWLVEGQKFLLRRREKAINLPR